MKISTKGRYALRMMLDLATHQGDGYVALKDIAQRQEISKKYLEQIVPMLGKSNILRTTRGYQGGYRLARAPQDYPWPASTSIRVHVRAAESAPPCPCGKGWSASSATTSTASRCRTCSSSRRHAPRTTTSSDAAAYFPCRPGKRTANGERAARPRLDIWYYQKSRRMNSMFFIVSDHRAGTHC